jgi:dTDP-4-dehydrorhamnose 3,5-epimerase
MAASIEGVRFGRLVRHGDDRGSFREAWRASWYAHDRVQGPPPTFVQANVSVSAVGVLRGLHLHRRQVDHWVVLEGRAFVGLVDVRPAIAGTGRPIVEVGELSVDDWLAIPIGVAHGFLALDPLTLLYLVSAEFDGTDELGFAWDDPLAGVPWPVVASTPDGRPVVSDRDRMAPPLDELIPLLRT